MKISENNVVVMHYAVSDSEGTLIDSSFDSEPLAIIHGTGYVIPGLEDALLGHETGDAFEVTIAADEAYGQRHDDYIQTLPISMFEGIEGLVVGAHLHADSDQGEQSVIVTAITEEEVTIDANHPLAGLDLHFKVEIIEVRKAAPEELEHGHVHNEEGCDQ